MTTTIDLKLEQETFHRLHELCDTKRTTIKVNRDDLAAVLMDYSIMLRALHACNLFKVREPSQQRQRQRPRLGSQSA